MKHRGFQYDAVIKIKHRSDREKTFTKQKFKNLVTPSTDYTCFDVFVSLQSCLTYATEWTLRPRLNQSLRSVNISRDLQLKVDTIFILKLALTHIRER